MAFNPCSTHGAPHAPNALQFLKFPAVPFLKLETGFAGTIPDTPPPNPRARVFTPKEPTMIWTDKIITVLRLLWAEGVPTAEIGHLLGCSKNAVVGKAHRLKLPGRPSPIPVKSDKPVKPKAVRLQGNITPSQVYRLPKPAPTAVRLAIGPQDGCQWPLDQQPCAEMAMPGKPYCHSHCQRAYVRRVA